MRRQFIKTLIEQRRKNPKIFLLTPDLGFSVLEDFRDEFPESFVNVGVAEQNAVGIAAGLALSGKVVYVYSIATFITLRCLEQIRNDACAQNLKVRIVGVGSGLSYGPAGSTHHSIEDIGIMRVLPNMAVLCPGDPFEAEALTRESINYPGPIYIRLGKNNEPNVHASTPKLKIGRGFVLEKGADLSIYATGNMLRQAQEVAAKLKQHNLKARLVSMPTLKPIDRNIILRSVRKTGAIFTIEEHLLTGGLGSAVAEIIAERGQKILFKRFALPDCFVKKVGGQACLRKANGLSVEKITGRILRVLKKG